MRLFSFALVFALAAAFFTARTHAQIPERILFQPGSYAYGSYGQPAAEVSLDESVVDESPQTDWEEQFGGKKEKVETEIAGEASTVVRKPVPYLAYHRSPWTGRTHVVPYEPGYANSPDEFPVHQSGFNRWISTLPCRTQNTKQIKYAGYHDPDPVIVTDKPSRFQLILGYPNAGWTTHCGNRWGTWMAQCPGVEPIPLGPYAEWSIKDLSNFPPVYGRPLGGIFQGVRGTAVAPCPCGEFPVKHCEKHCEHCTIEMAPEEPEPES